MSTSASNSSKIWLAAIGAVGAMVTLAVGIVTLAGVVLAAGIWKGNIENRMAVVEASSKEQVVTLASQVKEQFVSVTAACEKMVSAVERATDKRLTDIETDRRIKIDEFTHFRADTGARDAKVDALLTNQQKQIDTLVEISGKERPRR